MVIKNILSRFSCPKEKVALGLDIGTSTIKLVKLKFLKETVELSGFNIEPVTSDLGASLKKLEQSQNIKTINTGISGPASIIRYVNFPKLNKEEFNQSLKFEAKKHIPFLINEISLDGCILKPDLPDSQMLVLITAVKKDFLNQRLKIIGETNFTVNILDLDSLALVNAFNFNYSSDDDLRHKTIALLNIGASISNLNILEKGIPRLSRDITIAGNNLTQKIVDILGVDFNSAEKLKINTENERLKEVSAAIELILSNLSAEIRTSFDYYESQSSSSVEKIFLSGGGSLVKGLKETLSNSLSIEMGIWDPLKQLIIPNDSDIQKIRKLSGQFAVAIGLALRGIE